MAVNKNNERIYITFSKKQAEWLRRCAKKCNLQISDFVKWLIDKNVSRYFAQLNWQDQQYIKIISNDRNKINDDPLLNTDEETKEKWDHIFDGLGEEPTKEDEDEIPF